MNKAKSLAQRVIDGKKCSPASGRAALAEILSAGGDPSPPTPASRHVLKALVEMWSPARSPSVRELAKYSGASLTSTAWHLSVLLNRKCIERALPGTHQPRNYQPTKWGRECYEAIRNTEQAENVDQVET